MSARREGTGDRLLQNCIQYGTITANKIARGETRAASTERMVPVHNEIVPYGGDSRQPLQFNFEGLAVRTVLDENGDLLFVASDVCKVLEITNERNAYSRLDEDEKDVRFVDTPGGRQQMVVVNEAGLYSLILRSNKPQAKTFKRWITHEVLPAIRRTGAYSVQPMTTTQGLLLAVQKLADIEAEQLRLADQVKRISARQDEQDQVNNYFTIFGYAAYTSRHIDSNAASTLGKWATKYCKANNLHIGHKKDAVRGKLNTYPEDVLAIVFNAWRTQQPLFDE